jgi:hypothetical protein
MYASLSDIQGWIRDDVIPVNDANSKQPNIDAGRIIRARLAGVFAPVVLNTWDEPANTPEMIRGIAGRLAAAYVYRKYLSTESNDELSAYAQQLWNEAMMDLDNIRSGNTTVVDENNEPVDSTGANLLSFFPNNTTQPLFSVSDSFS